MQKIEGAPYLINVEPSANANGSGGISTDHTAVSVFSGGPDPSLAQHVQRYLPKLISLLGSAYSAGCTPRTAATSSPSYIHPEPSRTLGSPRDWNCSRIPCPETFLSKCRPIVWSLKNVFSTKLKHYLNDMTLS